ncbi:SPFH domain-containing protein [Helcobacillus massiliensis]|uniref:SPFH domain-containing protein n=1 Tax=Helcobacillus massiliensis TaxID=521392 RepID=UPI0021A87002|nr:SPFH domain-containing protein [Helcobacillus massiliensis]MCT1556741.1 SPFH domain-containing protein [Helcobacillus massiliensis]MCT2035565.1 SPFH domain-containing protein [Helcobacillus massiliensis]MCT2330983.1 SPFH domain-containing protein [Helcobacillus massiliensis]MDK7741857.1 SPFH domain-containing protein [Helcobacillus massiliensis]WOO92952.1 SPFH domain-containing protein [Helcobacillus massiliensis]
MEVLIAILIPIVILIAIVFALFGGLRSSIFFTVRTQENVIVESFGRFRRVAKPGLNMKVPFRDTLTPPISLRIQQLEVNIESKTKDNVFVTVPVAVQYVIREESVVDAYYRLSNPEAQIRSYVFDTVRSALSTLELDAAFESKDDIARGVENTLSSQMADFGFNIVNTLVTDISPDPRVRDSMNSINAAQRDRVAAQSLAEADKIKRVTQAEAEAESKRLQGEGVAAQRKAIALGIAEQYEMLKRVGIEQSAEQLLLMTQYFDTMQDVARNGRSNVLYLPSNPGSVSAMGDEIRNAMLQSQAAQKADDDADSAATRLRRAQPKRQQPSQPEGYQAAPQQPWEHPSAGSDQG